MNKFILSGLLFFCCCLLVSSCRTSSPEEYFDIAVLNVNLLTGFANEGQLRELQSPSVKMVEGKDQPVAMQRGEVINNKIQFVEESLQKLKGLKETPDTKDLLESSRRIYEYVLPVYKTEYARLAQLYDSRASNDQIQSLSEAIQVKYHSGYDELYNKLISLGKLYAERHSIKVNWGRQ